MKDHSVPFILLNLAKNGYTRMIGSNTNERGLPYFMKHNLANKIICLNGDEKTYRPLGELTKIDLSD